MPQQLSVLIVEDDPLLWKALNSRLQSKFSLTYCSDGESAVAELGKQQFDILLLDLVLPKKDGFAVLSEKAHTRNQNTPAIVITNLREEQHLKRAIALGAVECFVKAQLSLRALMERIAILTSNASPPDASASFQTKKVT